MNKHNAKIIESLGAFLPMTASATPFIIGYNAESWVRTTVDRYEKKYVPIFKFIMPFWNNGNGGMFIVSEPDYQASARVLLEDISMLKKIVDDFEHDYNNLLTTVSNLPDSPVEFAQHFSGFLHAYQQMYASGAMIDGFIAESDSVVLNMKKKYPEASLEIEALVEPPELHFIQEEELDLLIIARDSNNIEEDIATHREKYHWIHNNYTRVEKESIEYFRNRLKDMQQKGSEYINTTIHTLESYAETKKQHIAEIEEAQVFSNEDFTKLRMIGVVSLVMDRRKACNLMGNYWIGLYAQYIAEKTNTPYEDVVFLIPSEVEQLLAGTSITTFPIAERKEECTLFCTYDEMYVVSGEEAKEIRELVDPSYVDETGIVSGNTAYPGTVTGTAKVLTYATEKEVTEEDILITGMTRPDFVPLMKKAKAIITDQGGITCHAAIIARELKKPCIIGTKVATKAFKDGDIIEVNADEGIIRKV